MKTEECAPQTPVRYLVRVWFRVWFHDFTKQEVQASVHRMMPPQEQVEAKTV
jgi:hypothetical protein